MKAIVHLDIRQGSRPWGTTIFRKRPFALGGTAHLCPWRRRFARRCARRRWTKRMRAWRESAIGRRRRQHGYV